jgi:hypothetical protein
VTTNKLAPELPVSKGRNRRSDRYPVVVPVKVKWLEPSGSSVIEFAEAKEVNMHGGLLDMKGRPAINSVVELTNLSSTKTASAQVVALRPSKKGDALGIAIELLTPSETFWGVTFRLKMAIDDLLKLEKDMKDTRSGRMDPRVLREFRDAVDYVRKTAWALQELQERQAHQRDTATVRTLLTDERVRRGTQLSKALIADLDANEVSEGTAGAAELFRAIESLHQRLSGLFKIRESR